MAPFVEVYSARLDPDSARLDFLERTLAADERERAARFYFPVHRQHFIACRGILRQILGGFLKIAPAEVKFSYNAYGKPEVPDSRIRFNVSHSAGWALFAVTEDREVGIDLERIDARVAQELIPERFFSAWEAAQLRALPRRNRQTRFSAAGRGKRRTSRPAEWASRSRSIALMCLLRRTSPRRFCAGVRIFPCGNCALRRGSRRPSLRKAPTGKSHGAIWYVRISLMHPEPVLDLAHLGHVELLTPKPEESLNFFVNVFGMTESGREGDSVYLRAYDDYERHTLKLTASKLPGMGHMAFRARSPQALERRVAELKGSGYDIGWTKGDLAHGPAFLCQDPDGHKIELYYETQVV